MNKICVYTCITGDYDNLIEIINPEPDIDYFCFTNNKKIKSSTWKIIYIEDKNLSDAQLARKTKILGNEITEKYDITIWMDGNQYFKKSIHEFIKHFALTTPANFISFKHHARNCIYEEINACMQFKKEEKEKLLRIKEFYLKNNYPENNGLIESSIIIRKNHDKLVNKTMKMWFEYLLKYTIRDQLTFNYCVYRTNMPVSYIQLNIWDNEWTGYQKHNNLKSRIDFYRIYFGTSTKFELEKCMDGIYKKSQDNYELEIKVPNNTDTLEFEISEKENICVEAMETNLKKAEIFYLNQVKIDDKRYFYAKPVIIIKSKNLKKNSQLKITIKIKEINDYQEILKSYENLEIHNQKNIEEIKVQEQKLQNEIDIVNSQANKINEQTKEIENLKNELALIKNSRSWKFITSIRNKYHRIRRQK